MSGKSILFDRLSFKNFLSFGNSLTTVNLGQGDLTAVLGVNYDSGGEDSRNGVGKSAMIDALTYVLFGEVVRGIPNNQLVNKMIRKGQQMLVTLSFSKGEFDYLIERGEKPSKLLFFRKPMRDTDDIHVRQGHTNKYEITLSSKAETQKEIEKVLGFDVVLAQYLLVNSSETLPFSKIGNEGRRELIERLFGFNFLSERAEELKKERRDNGVLMTKVEAQLQATKQANARIERELEALKQRSEQWERQRQQTIRDLQATIDHLSRVDVEGELEVMKLTKELQQRFKELDLLLETSSRQHGDAARLLRTQQAISHSCDRQISQFLGQKEKLDQSVCPTCSQHWVPDISVFDEINADLEEQRLNKDAAEKEISEVNARIKQITEEKTALSAERKQVKDDLAELAGIPLTLDSPEEAATLDADIKNFRTQLKETEAALNPHLDSIQGMQENAIQPVDDTELRDLRLLQEHYDLLITLLTSNDSFLRKNIITRWLPRLNQKIAHYLKEMELPHRVRFQPDLSLLITDYGEEFAWNGLSKGQRQRVTIALNFAFQDLFEMMNYKINTLMVDELIDNGICQRGAENAVKIIRDKVRSRKKNVFLVTHRQDIASQIENQLTVGIRHKQSFIEDNDDC